MPDEYAKKFPCFSGRSFIAIKEHLDLVWKHMEEFGATYEVVYMKSLNMSLEGDARRWFNCLSLEYVNGYDMFSNFLIEELLVKLDA